MADSSVVARFNLSLDEVIQKPMVDLSQEQQRRQFCRPFVRYGMHWLLTIEKEAPSNKKDKCFNIVVLLYCLSVPIRDETYRNDFSLKGDIVIDQLAVDGQARTFNGQTGQACNLVGKQFPAKAVEMKEFTLSLESED